MKRDPRTDAPNFYRFARDYLHAYLPTVQGHSPRTIEAYRISLECFIDYLTDIEHIDRAEVSFDHFERQHLKAWLAWMIAQLDDRAAALRRRREGRRLEDRAREPPARGGRPRRPKARAALTAPTTRLGRAPPLRD